MSPDQCVKLGCAILHWPQGRINPWSPEAIIVPHRMTWSWYTSRWMMDEWAVTLVQRGRDWTGTQPAQAPPRCTKCNSPPINGQCTNHRIAVWWSVALHFNVPIKCWCYSAGQHAKAKIRAPLICTCIYSADFFHGPPPTHPLHLLIQACVPCLDYLLTFRNHYSFRITRSVVKRSPNSRSVLHKPLRARITF